MWCNQHAASTLEDLYACVKVKKYFKILEMLIFLSQGIVRISCKMSCSVTPQNNDIYELIIHDISIFSIFFKVKVI